MGNSKTLLPLVITGILTFYPASSSAGAYPSQIELGNSSADQAVNIDAGSGGAYLGVPIASAGDINGDGIEDFIISRPGINTVDVIFGTANGYASPLTLDGTNGFSMIGPHFNGVSARMGNSVAAAGDVNGDGFDDIIIGAKSADYNGNQSSGLVYLVYGKAGTFPASWDMETFSAADGVTFYGHAAADYAGTSVGTAGDFNHDGYSDIIIGANGVDAGPYQNQNGAAYVVFGGPNLPQSQDLGLLDGQNGFRILGSDGSYFYDETEDRLGATVSSAGDFNGDGIEDALVGAPGVDNGKVFIVFGKDTSQAGDFPATMETADIDGSNGFLITGFAGSLVGNRGASLADTNGDTMADIIVGAEAASFVIYGSKSPFPASFDLSTLDGSNGYVITGTKDWDIDPSGHRNSVASAGDMNGDGLGDILLGRPGMYHTDDAFKSEMGGAYVIFGQRGYSQAAFDTDNLNGDNGLVIIAPKYDSSFSFQPLNTGDLVHSAGDVNHDGVDDLLLSGSEQLSTYLVYGRAPAPTTLFSSVLPAARSGFVGGGPITVFGSVINAGAETAQGCRITLPDTAPVTLQYQGTNASNVPEGPVDGIFALAPGELKSFLYAFNPVATSNGENIFPNSICANGEIAAIPGVNTVYLSIGTVAGPDILSIGSTPSSDGIIAIPANSINFMSASAINIGAGDMSGSADASMTVTADDGGLDLPVLIQWCETDVYGTCMSPLGTNAVNTTIGDQPAYFAVFVTDMASGGMPLDPANKRVFLRFKDNGGIERSVTSAAITVE